MKKIKEYRDYDNSSTYTPTSSVGDDDEEEDDHLHHHDYDEDEDRGLLIEQQKPLDVEGLPTTNVQNIVATKKRCGCGFCRCCRYNFVVIALMMILLLFIIFIIKWTQKTITHPLATCDECYCITDLHESCPNDAPPKTNYSNTTIAILASQKAVNAYSLNCNPYRNIKDGNSCQTTPPQEIFDDSNESAVCGIHYDHPMVDVNNNNATNNTSLCETNTYHLQSYVNMTEALNAGAIVTHSGACGVCSTTQDLAAYLTIGDLTTEGIACGKKGLLGFHSGVRCYEALGFTHECSKSWIYNNYNTWRYCGITCATQTFLNKPYNGPPPTCQLNDCLTCDETYSGPTFQKIAGRTRRNSGLRSAIARPCNSFTVFNHESCPKTTTIEQALNKTNRKNKGPLYN